MSESSIVLPTGAAPYSRCHIHPMVIFNVLDHHIRRPDADRVIGVLLGNISDETGIVEVRNCFPVPHSEGESVRPFSLRESWLLLSHCICGIHKRWVRLAAKGSFSVAMALLSSKWMDCGMSSGSVVVAASLIVEFRSTLRFEARGELEGWRLI